MLLDHNPTGQYVNDLLTAVLLLCAIVIKIEAALKGLNLSVRETTQLASCKGSNHRIYKDYGTCG